MLILTKSQIGDCSDFQVLSSSSIKLTRIKADFSLKSRMSTVQMQIHGELLSARHEYAFLEKGPRSKCMFTPSLDRNLVITADNNSKP